MKKLPIIIVVFVLLLAGGYFGFKMYTTNVAKEKVDAAIEKSTDVAKIEYKDVSVDLIGMDVRISDIIVSPVGKEEPVTINEVIIYDIDEESDIPQFMSVAVRGISSDIRGREGRELRELGYTDTLMANLNASYVYDKEKKELNIRKLLVGADDVGEIDLSLHLSNIDLNEKKISFRSLFMIALDESEINYRDDSLIKRILKRSAKQNRMDEKKFKEMINREIDGEIKKGKDELAKKALTEIQKFINDPGELSISASPSEPYPIGSAMRDAGSPADMISALNVQITASKSTGFFFSKSDNKPKEKKEQPVSATGKAAEPPPVSPEKPVLSREEIQRQAKQGLGTIARNQEVYMVEHDTYSTSLRDIGFISKSEYYDFYMASADQNSYKAVAKSKAPGISGRGAGDDVWTITQDLMLMRESHAPKPAAPSKPAASPTPVSPPAPSTATLTVIQVPDLDLHSIFRRLEIAGFNPGPYREKDHQQLSEAVKRFQGFAKLDDSGVIDEATWAKMKRLYDPEASKKNKSE